MLSIHRNAEPQDVEGILKNFDLTSKYGPCLGLTRLQRYACVALCKVNWSTLGINEPQVQRRFCNGFAKKLESLKTGIMRLGMCAGGIERSNWA